MNKNEKKDDEKETLKTKQKRDKNGRRRRIMTRYDETEREQEREG